MMNIEQAIKLLDDASASIQTNRQGHIAIAQALEVIRKELIAQRAEPETRND